ncbi:MAG: alpha/beta hydrolase [Breznakibacter sp.]|nr:alpha/beta hydrolase [Breznakibacter sp.]
MRNRIPTKLLIAVTIMSSIFTQQVLEAQNSVIDLYPKGRMPNTIATEIAEKWDSTDILRISQVTNPNIAVFLPSPKNATGEAIVIYPGGGYSILAYDWEGTDIAKYWNAKGVAAIVLKYRLPDMANHRESWQYPLLDAQRALRMVRFHAKEWNIHPDKVGIMGFSAGGHLASSLCTHNDLGNPNSTDPVEQISCIPDFAMLIYPVISFTEPYQHAGSHKNLLGENPDPAQSLFFSSEMQVTSQTPPTILIHASDDTGVPVENSIAYYRALLKHNIPAELHIYPYGQHGFGLAIGKGYLSSWPERCYDWLKGL